MLKDINFDVNYIMLLNLRCIAPRSIGASKKLLWPCTLRRLGHLAGTNDLVVLLCTGMIMD